MMSARVCLPNEEELNPPKMSLDVPQKKIQKYEQDFSSSLFDYIKDNSLLRNFYYRLIYECEVAQEVIEVLDNMDIKILKDLIEKLTHAASLEEVAIYDSEFHKNLFAIAGKEDFFNWWTLQSKDLQEYLKNFWNYIGYQTKFYYQLMDIHKNILEAIINRNKNEVIKEMEKHFSILLFQLLGTVYGKKQILINENLLYMDGWE